MTAELEFSLNRASAAEIAEHLSSCDENFIPTLSSRVAITDYAEKLVNKATRFEAWAAGLLVGLLAVYCNDRNKHIAYITSVSIRKMWMGEGIAAFLLGQCIEHAKAAGMRQVSLEVASDNSRAIRLYQKSGFVGGRVNGSFLCMDLVWATGAEDDRQI